MAGFFPLRPEARRLHDRIAARVADQLAGGPNRRDAEIFEARLERAFEDLHGGLHEVYGQRADFESLLDRLADAMIAAYLERPEDLRSLDIERMTWADWFQHPSMVGYIAYADRFGGTLEGVRERLDYLSELGVGYLHLMPFLAPRSGPSDGGYATADFRRIDPDLGTMEDLEALTRALRERRISLCCDLVLNHVADQHPWARAAARGHPRYRDYFHVFADRTRPNLYEETLPEIFPATDPGNFTFVENLGWVWTTFHRYQWDLDWSNPEVFLEIADVILFLANRGVEVFRLDAIAFLWKRLGTTCQNQPEVHAITRALRAVARAVAPAIAFKAEAIVGPDDLIHYLGTGRHHGMVSDLAYHNVLMVQYWSTLATRDTTLMNRALGRFPAKPDNTAWATYIRCHDDIGWAIADEDAAAVGWDGPSHRRFLAEYYAGEFEGSHARGAVFQADPRTGDRRSSGTTASLAGLEEALASEDPHRLEMAIERILLGHALIMGWAGVPLVYMGDELGLTNDYAYRDDPEVAHDNRWMHRPRMPWDRAERRARAGTIEQRIFRGIAELARTRKRTPHLHARWPLQVVETGDDRLFAHVRRHPTGDLLAVYNFSEEPAALRRRVLADQGIEAPHDRIGSAPLLDDGRRVPVPPYGRLWITDGGDPT